VKPPSNKAWRFFYVCFGYVMGILWMFLKAQISEVDRAFKEFARNTLKKDLSYLVNEGLLVKTGEKQEVRHHLNN
jgi:hypothetical protein